MIWSDSYLDNLLTRGEIEISAKIPCIFHRFSLSVTSGTATYDLPSGIFNILQITWKGDPVYPLDHTDLRTSAPYYKPLNAGSQTKPYNYLRIGYGYAKIEFRPVPNETIAADDTYVFGSGIADRVIISCFKVAEPDGDTYRIPNYIRRRITKYYALWKAFAKEGKGQNIIAADYFRNRYEFELKLFDTITKNVTRAIQYRLGDVATRTAFPAKPLLPSDYRNVGIR